MKKLFCISLLVVLGAAMSAQAGWVDMTASWTGQGLASSSVLFTDPTTGTLYYMNGSAVKSYNAGNDTWSDITTTGTGSYNGNFADFVTYADGKFICGGGRGADTISVYDIANQTWSTSTIEKGSYEGFDGINGATYNSSTGTSSKGTFWAFWSSTTGRMGSPYDVSTGGWGTPVHLANTDLNWGSSYGKFEWCGQHSVSVNGINYCMNREGTDDQDRTVFIWSFDESSGDFPDLTGTHTSEYDLGTDAAGDRYLNNSWNGSAYVVDNQANFMTSMLTADGDLVYVIGNATGSNPSGDPRLSPVLVYDTVNGTWSELDGLPDSYAEGYRNRTCAVADGFIYVQDGGQFYAYAIPEPATMSLLAIGGIGLLIRRRRRS